MSIERGWDDRAPGGAGDSYVAIEALLRSAQAPPRPARAIELGCGGGQATILLARRGYDTLGIDFSPSAIDLARRNAAEAGFAISFAVADCLDAAAAIEAGAFDLAIDNHALHCLVEPRHRHAFLGAAHRALRPGGIPSEADLDAELAAAGFEVVLRERRAQEPGTGALPAAKRSIADASWTTFARRGPGARARGRSAGHSSGFQRA